MGKVESVTDTGSTKMITFSSPVSDSFTIDQSIAHDGVCLTVINVGNGTHTVQVIDETLSKSTLGKLKQGDFVNLEKSLSLQTLLDGHMVQGHVDTSLMCTEIKDLNGSWKMEFNLPDEYSSLIISQGSISINGVSLTVADLNENSFAVAIIPYTFKNTTFQFLKVHDLVNIEFDLIGKYIIRQLNLRNVTE